MCVGSYEVRIPATILTGWILLLGPTLTIPERAYAQRVLLDEDFENDVPDTLPASADTFNRSLAGGVEVDPAGAFVSGGMFADPFDPGNNQSLVLHNPNSVAQEAINWFSIFPDDFNDPHYFLKNGVIQFDVYVDELQPDGWWGFLGIRFGFQENPEDRNQVTTEGDQTIWNSLRFQEGGANGSTNILFDQPHSDNYENVDLLTFETPLRVRYEIDGENASYTVSIDKLDDPDEPVDVIWIEQGETSPWVERFNFITFQNEPVPGINEITFITDASALGAGSMSAPNIYLDNLLIIDNDQEPPGLEADFNKDNIVDGDDFLIWQSGFGTATGATPNTGDADGDGAINGDDFLIWQTQFGMSTGGNGGVAVPEPGTLMGLGLLAASATLLRRRSQGR